MKQQAGQQRGGGGGGGFGHPFGGGFPGGFQGGFHFQGGQGGHPFGNPFGGHHQQQRQQERPKENLYEPDSPVTSLKQGRFPGHDAKHVWLIEFYAPWCAHCREMKPVWERLAGEMAGVIKVGAVNCELEKALCSMHNANSFPLIKIFRGGNSVQYDGTAVRDRDAVWVWAHDQLPTAQLVPLSPRRPETLDAFLSGPCAKPAVTEGKGGACVVFLHRDAMTQAWTKSLSFFWRGRVPMGEAKGHGVEEMGAKLGVTRLPAAVALCGGDPRRVLEAPKPTEREGMEAWVAGLEKACPGVGVREKPTLSPSTDFSKLKVGELRALLASRGAACTLCAEKADFVREVKALAEAEAAAAAGGGGEGAKQEL